MNKIKLKGMSLIFYCTKLHLSKFNGSSVVYIKQNMNFDIQSPPRPYLLFSQICSYYKLAILQRCINIQYFMVPLGLVQILHRPLKF
jgi:hypothetical protein